MRKMKGVENQGIAGFTLVELMIALVISGIIAASIYSAYISQQHTYLVQDQVAEMQQNLRAGIVLMASDIRMAGYDPNNSAGAGIVNANAGQISFTEDVNGDGDTADAQERIDYGFRLADDNTRDGIPDSDGNGDGVPDAVSLRMQTQCTGCGSGTKSGYQAIAENIQAIEFQYLDGNGNVLPLPLSSQANRDKIRSVRISILARAGMPDRKFTNTMTYTTASGATWGPYNDNYRRRLLIQTVNCRNMGL